MISLARFQVAASSACIFLILFYFLPPCLAQQLTLTRVDSTRRRRSVSI